ncbi:Xaa-Pro peptidase family protein [Acidianus sp. HS-5]|uniref:M24 family metallopeptidase n=1 Tax=Acidianus sp. HS-5 TaxID=2886040 RepID=UPI001F1E7704|nr:Xaa-Pro peptidase family protein [Acidianus sp. HS-5]
MNRVKKLQNMMKEKGIDYVVIGPTSNMFYLTGFTEEQMERPLFFIVGEGTCYFLAPKLYEEQLSKYGFEIISYVDGEDAYSKIDIKMNSTIAIDDQLWSLFTVNLIKKFSPSTLLIASTLLKELRMRKDEKELEIMKEGLNIAEKSFMQFLNEIKEGDSECKLADKLEEIFKDNGAEGVSFKPILTSGPNTSMPHLRCTDRKVKRGDIIIVDFGVKYKGYSTDTTRVVSLGKPSGEVENIHDIVLEAQESAERAKNGMKGKEIDSIAREIISKAGYSQFFIHRTGHGIGIDVHEDPYISQDSEQVIEENMTFTVEPGIYLPEKFGIRIEDMVVMGEKEAYPLNKLRKDIYVI